MNAVFKSSQEGLIVFKAVSHTVTREIFSFISLYFIHLSLNGLIETAANDNTETHTVTVSLAEIPQLSRNDGVLPKPILYRHTFG